MIASVEHVQSPDGGADDVEVFIALGEVNTLVKRSGERRGVIQLSDVYRNFTAVVGGHQRYEGELLSLTVDSLVYIGSHLIEEYDTPEDTKHAVEDSDTASKLIGSSILDIMRKEELKRQKLKARQSGTNIVE